jgi:hypothetical protein
VVAYVVTGVSDQVVTTQEASYDGYVKALMVASSLAQFDGTTYTVSKEEDNGELVAIISISKGKGK